MRVKSAHQGFTLVELLVVISIIAILSVIGITIFSSAQKAARDSKRRADLEALAVALEQYKSTNGSYPAGLWNNSACPGVSSWQNWTLENCKLTGYLAEMPQDPLKTDTGNCGGGSGRNDDGCHIYRYCSDGKSFTLSANLETGTAQPYDDSCPSSGLHLYYRRSQQ